MLFVGSLLYPNFTSGQAHPRPARQERLPHPAGHRHDLRHPERRHRPVRRCGDGARLGDRGQPAAGRLVGVRWSSRWCCWRPAGLGLVVGIMISRFEIQPFIATLAAMFLARGLCLVITDRSIAIDNELLPEHEPRRTSTSGSRRRSTCAGGSGSPTSTPRRRCSSRSRAGRRVRRAALQPLRPDGLRGRRQRGRPPG